MTWSISAQPEHAARRVADVLDAGLDAGQAMQNAVLQAELDGTLVPRRVLVGDPRVLAAPRLVHGRLTTIPTAPADGHRRSRPPDAPLATVPGRPRRGDWRRDLGQLLGTEAGGSRLAEPAALAYAIAERGWATWLDAWTNCGRVAHVVAACPRCAESMEAYDGLLPSGSRRSCRICTRCRVVVDTPVGIDVELEHRPTARLTVDWRPHGSWAGRVRVSSAAGYDTRHWAWPRRDGRPRRTVRLRHAMPPGPLRLSAVLVDQRGVVVITRMDWSPPE